MKNSLNILLAAVLIYLLGCIYLRTPYFNQSISTQEMTFIITEGDSIVSSKYYRDLDDNWILLDKGIVLNENQISHMIIKADLEDLSDSNKD